MSTAKRPGLCSMQTCMLTCKRTCMYTCMHTCMLPKCVPAPVQSTLMLLLPLLRPQLSPGVLVSQPTSPHLETGHQAARVLQLGLLAPPFAPVASAALGIHNARHSEFLAKPTRNLVSSSWYKLHR
jgi:hypothetical protein